LLTDWKAETYKHFHRQGTVPIGDRSCGKDITYSIASSNMTKHKEL